MVVGGGTPLNPEDHPPTLRLGWVQVPPCTFEWGPEERAPKPAASFGAPPVFDKEQPKDCAICLVPLAFGDQCTLPCTHTFHALCVEGLRSFGIKQVCPMCRVELPPGPEKLFDEATRRYFDMERLMDGGKAPWSALTTVQQRESDEVLRLFKSAAEQGGVGAQHNLGAMYAQGHGVTRDHTEAMRWCRMAAKQGCADAQSNLGLSYKKGHGVRQDYSEALRWLQKAADQGHTVAQVTLGDMFYYGEGDHQDKCEAAWWYIKAADQGNIDAQASLGDMYHRGEGVN